MLFFIELSAIARWDNNFRIVVSIDRIGISAIEIDGSLRHL